MLDILKYGKIFQTKVVKKQQEKLIKCSNGNLCFIYIFNQKQEFLNFAERSIIFNLLNQNSHIRFY